MARPVNVLIDAIVLAFSRSRLRDLVGTDALKMVLQGTKELLPRPDTLALQPVWDLLEEQPGFVPDDAIPPLAAIKSWELRLKMIVVLPSQLAELTLTEREVRAAECIVKEAELAKLLADPLAPKTSSPIALEPSAVAASRAAASHSRRKVIFASVFLLLGIAAVIVSFKLTFDETKATKLSPGALSQEIPLVQVRQSGTVIGAVLSDAGWLAKPEAERRKQLETALVNAGLFGAKDIMVFDAKGKLIVSVAMRGKPIVTFTR